MVHVCVCVCVCVRVYACVRVRVCVCVRVHGCLLVHGSATQYYQYNYSAQKLGHICVTTYYSIEAIPAKIFRRKSFICLPTFVYFAFIPTCSFNHTSSHTFSHTTSHVCPQRPSLSILSPSNPSRLKQDRIALTSCPLQSTSHIATSTPSSKSLIYKKEKKTSSPPIM